MNLLLAATNEEMMRSFNRIIGFSIGPLLLITGICAMLGGFGVIKLGKPQNGMEDKWKKALQGFRWLGAMCIGMGFFLMIRGILA